jgi:hypothetical protein
VASDEPRSKKGTALKYDRSVVALSMVQLRDHPLMTYGKVPNWPPTWVRIMGKKGELPKGEVGTLKEVMPSRVSPDTRLFLIIDYNGGEYMGCLLFSDKAFCRQLEKLLPQLCNRPISEIASLDLSHTF